MSKRRRGVPPATRPSLVVLLTLLPLLLIAAPAVAVEEEAGLAPDEGAEEEAPPDIEELCAANEIVAEYCPEPYEQPTVLPPILYALLVLGGLIAAALFAMYMRWLPNFAQERRAKAKGRR